jgi:hypothetical protein
VISRHGAAGQQHQETAQANATSAAAARDRRAAADARREEAQALAARKRLQAANLRSDIEHLDRQLAEVVYRPADVAPAPGEVTALRTEYRALAAELDGKINATGIREMLEKYQRDATEKRAKYERRPKKGWTDEAIERELLGSLADWGDAEGVHDRVKGEHEVVRGRTGNQKQALDRAKDALSKAVDAARTAGVDVPDPDVVPRESLDDPSGERAAAHRSAATEAVAREEFHGSLVREAFTIYGLAVAKAETASQRRTAITGTFRLVRVLGDQHDALLSAYAVGSATAHEGSGLPAAASPIMTARPTGEQADALLEREAKALEPELKLLASDEKQYRDERDRLARGVTTWVSHPEFAHLRDAIYTRLREAPNDVLEAHAEELSADLELRATHLAGAVAEIDRHRDRIIQLTLAAAEQGRRLLRQAGERSLVPPRVPRLGGRRFLQVSNVDGLQDAAAEVAAIGALVDEWARSEKGIPKPVELIQQAVRRVAPRISLRVLFPDAAAGEKLEPITRLGRWSTGERLTASTLLYCTLARVRALSRGAVADASSVLLCDNPIGAASRATFLDAQREVARALKVQLVYFTGVNDLGAVASMPNVLCLENQMIDARTGHQIVRVATDGPSVSAIQLYRSEERYPLLTDGVGSTVGAAEATDVALPRHLEQGGIAGAIVGGIADGVARGDHAAQREVRA